MDCAILTPFPWVASKLVGALNIVEGTVRSVIAPGPHAHFDWSSCPVRDKLLQVGAPGEIAPIFAGCPVDVLLSWGFPWKIPGPALSAAQLGALNLHPSRLPKYRGPSPLAWALRNGEEEIGVTWHRMTESFDAGPILAQSSFVVDDADADIMMIGPKVDALALDLLPGVIELLFAGERGSAQLEEEATAAPLFRDDSYTQVDWGWPARAIHNQVRAWSCSGMSGRLNAPRTVVEGRRVVLEQTSLTHVQGCTSVQAGDGALWIVRCRAVEEASS